MTGGALAKMLPWFQWGLGGRLGDGHQYQSWITLDDVVRAFEHALKDEAVSGPLNAVSPNPATNSELTRELGRVLKRPTALPAPAFALRLALGELAGELLSSQRVAPTLLQSTGFEFAHPKLETALRTLLAQT